MKLIIDGREYDGAAQPFIGDLRLLKREFGYGYGEVIERLQGLDEDANILALLDDDGFLDALVAWMWMSRLRAGERDCTRADAEMVALDQIEFVREAGDDEGEQADAIPTSAPTGSVRGAANPPAAATVPARTPRSSRTSRPRSIPA